MVSVSRFAGPPHFGQVQLTKESIFASGLSPPSPGSKFSTFGSFSGSSSYGTPTIPQCGQWTIGIGSPQYL